jgi:hypothetical protein
MFDLPLTVLVLLCAGGLLVPTLVRELLLAYARRNPYFHLSDYMERFWLVKHNDQKSNRAARVHHIKRSDHDRALHDHPWNNCSIVMRNGYWEVVPGAFQQSLENGTLLTTPAFAELGATIAALPGAQVPRAQRNAYAAMGVHWRGRGAIVRRRATSLHRLVLPAGREAWSLFMMGPKIREWGFQTPGGWVHNVEYTRALGRDV